MKLKLKEGLEVRNSRWEGIMIGSKKTGLLVSYDVPGKCVLLYTADEYRCTLDVTPENWEQVAHAYLTKHKLVSPWEEV